MKNSLTRFLPIFLLVSFWLAGCGAALPAAVTVKPSPAGSRQVDFVGKVEAVNGAQWTIDGQTFEISDPARLGGNFQVGDEVRVSATVNADGSVKIERVEAFAPHSLNSAPAATAVEVTATPSPLPAAPEVSPPAILGTVSSIQGSQWVIGGQTFLMTPATVFRNTPVVGDLVKVFALPNADGTFTVTAIELAPAAATPVPGLGNSNPGSTSPGEGSSEHHGDGEGDGQDDEKEHGSDD
jgi:hypothetical protein